MNALRLALTVIMLAALLVSIPAALAQGDSDGDGLPDDVDKCPNAAGPRENGGCPYRATATPQPDSPPDLDGDGTTDGLDACPETPGPAGNNGCPVPAEVIETDPEIELAPLPALPIAGPCVMATAGHIAVNLRSLPFATAPVTGSMDPQEIYPVHYFFDNPQDERWNQTVGGLAASWVTRLGGTCRGLPVLSFAEDDDGSAEFMLVSQWQFPADLVGFNPQPEPPANPFRTGDFPFPDPQSDEQVLLARFGPDHPPDPILVGLLLPAVQKAQEAADTSGEEQELVFVIPGDWEGFNPQPEPPPEGGDMGQFAIMLKIMPATDDNSDDDQSPMVPMAITIRNMTGAMQEVQACDSSMMPTADTACLYTSDGGMLALCTLGDSGMTYCMYGDFMNGEPGAG